MKMIRCIPFLKCNRQVDYIDKSYCSLMTVPEDIIRFSKTLEELNLNSNHIRELPKSFFRLTKLRKLSIHDNEIQVIPPEIGNLIYLVEFNASKNDYIEEIPDSIRNCTQLQIVDFSSTYITSLPPGFTHLQNLTTLYLNFTGLSELPSDFGNLTSLESLELRDNNLSKLPVSFGNLTNLIRLDLGVNSFQSLSPIIGQLSSLEELWLDMNQLTILPPEIGNLKRLQSLDVTKNVLEQIPDRIYLMENLIDLHLSENKIEELPDGIGHLSNLTILKLDQNKLSGRLNPNIGGCKSLQELMLTNNELVELPATIGNLINLEILNLDLNKLEQLPSTICNLTKLSVISLRNNELTHLPNEMGQLKKLHVLDVANNKLEFLPYSITQLSLVALWLSENQSHPLLKFQTDIDPRTKNKVLTCFLLPQYKENDSKSIENLLDSTLQRINSINWEKPKSTVKFFENDVAIDEEENDVQFVRHNTPHPKELKARHQKLFNKENDQLTNQQSTVSIEHQQEQQDEQTNESMQLSTKSDTESSEETSSVIVRQGYESSNLMTNKTSTIQNLNEIDSAANQDMLDNYLDIQHHRQSNNQYQQDQPDNLDDNQYLQDDNQYLQNDNQYPQDDNQYQEQNYHDYNDYQLDNRHVLFDQYQQDGEFNELNNDENALGPQSKLRRRDTPHHLKNKRINAMTNKADADKVNNILNTLNNQMNYDDQASSSNVNNFNNNVNNIEHLDYVGQSINYQTGPFELKQLLFPLKRSPKLGLGLSIAGGRGSTPYKYQDESIFVSNVAEGSPAHVAGLLKGDKILKVNEISLENAEHYYAVQTFKNAGDNFTVVVSREVPINFTPTNSSTSLHSTTTATNQFMTTSSNYSNGGIRNLAFDNKINHNTNQQINYLTLSNEQGTNYLQSSNNNQLLNNHLNNQIETNNLPAINPKIEYATLKRSHLNNDIGITVNLDNSNNIFIDSITNNQLLNDGKIRIGDRLTSINGSDVRKMNLEGVRSILLSKDLRFIRIVVERD